MTMMMMMRNRRNRNHSVSTCVQDAYGISDIGYPTGSGSYYCHSDSVSSGYHFGTETVDDDVSLAAGLCCSYDVVNLHVFAPPHDFFSLHRDYHDCPCRGGNPVSLLYGFQTLSVDAHAWEHRRILRLDSREGLL
jgi:hypothetical protein